MDSSFRWNDGKRAGRRGLFSAAPRPRLNVLDASLRASASDLQIPLRGQPRKGDVVLHAGLLEQAHPVRPIPTVVPANAGTHLALTVTAAARTRNGFQLSLE